MPAIKSLLRVALASGLALAAAPAAASQPADPAPQPTESEPLPAASDLFDKYVEAIGGQEKVRAITDRKITGTYDGAPFEFPARLTMWQKAPNKIHVKLDQPAGITIEMAYNGEAGWERVGDTPARPLEGDRLEGLRDSAAFYGEADYRTKYAEVETVGADTFADRPAYLVRAVSPEGQETTIAFDAENGLFLGTRRSMDPGNGQTIELEVRLLDYKEFGGVKYPTMMVQQFVGTDQQMVFRYRQVEFNTGEEHDYGPPPDLTGSGSGG